MTKKYSPLPENSSAIVIQERVSKREPNPGFELTKKDKAAFRFREPSEPMIQSSKKKVKPRWIEHDSHANKNGKRQLIVLDDGTEYKGEWKQNLRHGEGKHFTAKGMYDGEFKDDEYDGHGCYFIWSQKPNVEGLEGMFILYDGGWKEGKMSGEGKQWTLTGDVYEGNFLKGKRSGKGVMKYANGDIYEGDWENDLRNGNGKLTKVNGDWFEGVYVNDERNGQGQLHLKATERRLEGIWKDDSFAGGSYYDEPLNPKYVLPTDISGTTDGMIPVIDLADPEKVLRETKKRIGYSVEEEPIVNEEPVGDEEEDNTEFQIE